MMQACASKTRKELQYYRKLMKDIRALRECLATYVPKNEDKLIISGLVQPKQSRYSFEVSRIQAHLSVYRAYQKIEFTVNFKAGTLSSSHYKDDVIGMAAFSSIVQSIVKEIMRNPASIKHVYKRRFV